MLPLTVTPNFFDLLGVPVAQGRGFTTAEALPERQAGVAVISHAFWQNRLGSDRAAVGRILTFNGRPYTVLGILPAGLRAVPGLGIAPEVYLPISHDLLPEIDRRDSAAVMLIGRMRPGQPLEQGRAVVAEAHASRGTMPTAPIARSRSGNRSRRKRPARCSRSPTIHPSIGCDRRRSSSAWRRCRRRVEPHLAAPAPADPQTWSKASVRLRAMASAVWFSIWRRSII